LGCATIFYFLIFAKKIVLNKTQRRPYRLAKYIFYRQTLIRPIDHFWTFLGSFICIGSIGIFNFLSQQDNFFLIGSFGASAVLVFGSPNSPLAQPRNLIGGHLLSALIGVTLYKLFPETLWLSSSLAVSLSIVFMQMTKTMHPPGGATALIANIGTEKVKVLGYSYVLSPVLTGVFIIFVTAYLINNIPRDRHYPAKSKVKE
jgi:CBS domain-containing membrane protein